jgi:hypothetical protein
MMVIQIDQNTGGKYQNLLVIIINNYAVSILMNLIETACARVGGPAGGRALSLASGSQWPSDVFPTKLDGMFVLSNDSVPGDSLITMECTSGKHVW